MDARLRWSGLGPAAAWWLIGGPLLFVLGSLTPAGFSPTNMYRHGLFGLAAWSVAVVPAAMAGVLPAGRLGPALGAGWGLICGLTAVWWRGGHLNSWPLGLEALAWLLILPAGAWGAARMAGRGRGPVLVVCWSLVAVGIGVWITAHFLAAIR